MLCLVTLLTRN